MIDFKLNPASLRRAGAKLAAVAGFVLLGGAPAASAQSAIIYGQLGNFDISNDTGQVCHGFEVDIDGVAESEIPNISFFTVNRYGAPSIAANGVGGVVVRWSVPYDAASQTWADRTLQHTVPWFPGQCYQWTGPGYKDSGCEHFGVRTVTNTGPIRSRWLCEDALNPGVLTPMNPPTPVPGPTYFVQPPLVANNPPQLVIVVEAPEPAERPDLFGDAQWMRVFVRQLPVQINLDQLVADNPNVVPMDLAQLESDYAIIQEEPVAGGNGNRRRKRNQGDIAPTTRAVVRRIEMYRYTGNYDPVTHEALCADLVCKVPSAGELGDLVSVQMTGVNVTPDAVILTKSGTGGGVVSSTDRLLSCGTACASNYTAGQSVTLTAKPDSKSTFAGWTGACAGTASCTVAANGPVAVGATFTLIPVAAGGGGGGGGTVGASFTLSVSNSNNKAGTVTGTPAGDKAISCGSACSSKFASGTAVTLTATPIAGKAFLGWAGACAGTSATCTVTMSANLSVQATFSK